MGLTGVSVRRQRELTPPGFSLCDVYFADLVSHIQVDVSKYFNQLMYLNKLQYCCEFSFDNTTVNEHKWKISFPPKILQSTYFL